MNGQAGKHRQTWLRRSARVRASGPHLSLVQGQTLVAFALILAQILNPTWTRPQDNLMHDEQQDTGDERTLTQRVLDQLGTRTHVAAIVSKRVGFRITRQAITKWYRNGALPFTSADLYARVLAHEARKQSFDVTKEQLLNEVQVPDNRLPLKHRVA